MVLVLLLLLIQVPPQGIQCERIHSTVPDVVASELKWAWDSLSSVTCCRSLVIVYDAICVIQIGYASSNEGEEGVVDSNKLMQGSIYQGVVKSGSQSYLANLSLYPGKSELPFLPSNTQAVILQPTGDKGIAILGGDTIRGFTTSESDQVNSVPFGMCHSHSQ
ncbi:protein COFACTOR ASSEMBLY OF COMPLEX C SUBUNIT B CCB4, chloroplastic-like [Bidens hawaiensis]|uniref:protein COFACTOR ASSEMBLY OF COMPLEX C SUBUNIT B CCB4, chloroplastic-like n=1 Tax=Bidens hawaiensis TaxID=980011 RepID=UPI00404A40C4